jgi:heat shock protein 5
VVGVQRNGRVEILSNDQGNRIAPAFVGFAKGSGERLMGGDRNTLAGLDLAD